MIGPMWVEIIWANLSSESIEIARNGFEIYSYSGHAIEDKTKWLQMPEYGWSNYLNEDGSVKKEGDISIVILVGDC